MADECMKMRSSPLMAMETQIKHRGGTMPWCFVKACTTAESGREPLAHASGDRTKNVIGRKPRYL